MVKKKNRMLGALMFIPHIWPEVVQLGLVIDLTIGLDAKTG
jgi:hypothetical protein